MTTIEVLRAARVLITDESRWIRGRLAMAADGSEVCPEDSSAACWCAAGAICRAAPFEWGAFEGAVDALTASVPCGNVSAYNDDPSTSHADVLAAFDRAIAAEAAKEAT